MSPSLAMTPSPKTMDLAVLNVNGDIGRSPNLTGAR
jgi:hypothetical protein